MNASEYSKQKTDELLHQYNASIIPYDALTVIIHRAFTAGAESTAPDKQDISADPKPFKVRMKWGSGMGGDQKPQDDYDFATPAELNAFLEGCEQANGWLDMEQINPLPDGTFPEEETTKEEEED